MDKNIIKTALYSIILSSAPFTALSNDIVDDNHEIKTQNNIPNRVYNIFENAEDICAKFDGTAGNSDVVKQITDIFNTLQKSPNGKFISDFSTSASLSKLVTEKDDGKLWVCFTDIKGENLAEYYTGKAILAVDDKKDTQNKLISTVHEIRHFWQEANDFDGSYYLLMPPFIAFAFSHLSEADAESFAASVAWELKQAGLGKTWDNYSNDKDCEEVSMCYASFAKEFEKSATKSSQPTLDGTIAMFKKYMRDDIAKDSTIRQLIHNRSVLGIEEKEEKDIDIDKQVKGLKTYFRSGNFDGIGKMSQGRNYIKSGDVFNKLYPPTKPTPPSP